MIRDLVALNGVQLRLQTASQLVEVHLSPHPPVPYPTYTTPLRYMIKWCVAGVGGTVENGRNTVNNTYSHPTVRKGAHLAACVREDHSCLPTR